MGHHRGCPRRVRLGLHALRDALASRVISGLHIDATPVCVAPYFGCGSVSYFGYPISRPRHGGVLTPLATGIY